MTRSRPIKFLAGISLIRSLPWPSRLVAAAAVVPRPRRPRPRRQGQQAVRPQRSGWRRPAWGTSSSTPRAAPCICSRPTPAPRARALARAQRRGRRCGPPASRRRAAARRRHWSDPPLALTANPQVTYNGHPLYLYAGDQKPGDTNGQAITGFGAPWFVLTPAGTQISTQPSSGSGSGSVSGY